MKKNILLTIMVLSFIGIALLLVNTLTANTSNTGLLEATNTYRQSKNVAPLTEVAALDSSAMAKCQDMQARHYYNHNSPTGESWTRFFPDKTKFLGENLAEDFDNVLTVDAWIKSPEHEKNLSNPMFKFVGFAVCKGRQGRLVVQHLSN